MPAVEVFIARSSRLIDPDGGCACRVLVTNGLTFLEGVDNLVLRSFPEFGGCTVTRASVAFDVEVAAA